MSSCLGIYIENNLIKYAKVTKERDVVKVDAFGVKFYEKLEEAIEQIVNETFSYHIPISVNLQNENYNYFEMFSLLNDKDMTKAIETEFELLCEEKGYNKNTLDSRYVLVNSQENREKVKAMHISANKSEIEKLIGEFQKYSLKTIVPLPIAIANDIEIGVKENTAILNLEEKVSLTTIINGQVDKVDILTEGMERIYNNINKKENSYAKVYDILKNTTIYTAEGKELQDEENEYLEDIMPTLYSILTTVKELITANINNIDKLYITGTGAVINNIDLYFQEYLLNTKCEVMKPYFMKNVSVTKTNIKDYIEVNSAIALGLQGIGEGIKNINFKTVNVLEKLKEISGKEVGGKKKGTNTSNKKGSFKLSFDLGEKLDNVEVGMLRFAGTCLMILVVYVIGTTIITNMIRQKQKDTEELIADTHAQIAKVTADIQTLNNKTTEYNTLIKNLESINEKIANENSARNAVPNLMSRIMVHVPKNVQITSIQNTTGKHVVIQAQAEEYDPLGYFLAAIDTKGILVNAKSNNGVKQNNIVRITIEGDMP